MEESVVIPLAECLCMLLKHHLTNQLFPNEIDEESIEDSIGTPIFVIFRYVLYYLVLIEYLYFYELVSFIV